MGTDTAVSREAGDREFGLQLQVLVLGYFSVALTTIESFDQKQSEFGRLRQEEAEVEKLSAEASQKTLHFVADGSPGTFAWLSGSSKLLKCPKGVNTRVKCMPYAGASTSIENPTAGGGAMLIAQGEVLAPLSRSLVIQRDLGSETFRMPSGGDYLCVNRRGCDLK